MCYEVNQGAPRGTTSLEKKKLPWKSWL